MSLKTMSFNGPLSLSVSVIGRHLLAFSSFVILDEDFDFRLLPNSLLNVKLCSVVTLCLRNDSVVYFNTF